MANPPSANDQRSNVMNSNNQAFKDNLDNRSNQLNPNNAATKGGTAEASETGEAQQRQPNQSQ